MGKIKIGDSIPTFTLLDQNNVEVKIKNKVGTPLVIYFYPKDDTPGCTREACGFRDDFEDFADLGAEIFGISSDSPRSHKRFAEKYRLNFTLLSDSKKEVEKLFGVKRNLFGLLLERVTFVVDKEGIVRHIFNSQFEAKKHVQEALNILQKF
jgi:peroxiredoxin Q/BCP